MIEVASPMMSDAYFRTPTLPKEKPRLAQRYSLAKIHVDLPHEGLGPRDVFHDRLAIKPRDLCHESSQCEVSGDHIRKKRLSRTNTR